MTPRYSETFTEGLANVSKTAQLQFELPGGRCYALLNSMDLSMKFLFLFIFFGSTTCIAADTRNASLPGDWNCGPYSMAAQGVDMIVNENVTFAVDGGYRETSKLSARLAGGKVITTQSRSLGRWTRKGDIIEIRYDKVEFLSSDNPVYTKEMGQADADAQQKKRNWAKYKILALNKKLSMMPVETMYKAAEVKVSCVRP